jgi:hypothetical protein
MDETVVRKAKGEARRRGKSVSQMVSEFFDSLGPRDHPSPILPPLTKSLIGVLKGCKVSEKDYVAHLRKKHQ